MSQLNDIVNSANPDQLRKLAAYAQYMGEAVSKHCNCPSECNKNCQVVKDLNESFQLVGKRLGAL